MTDEFFAEILKKEYDGVSPRELSPRELSPLVLAYIGDAVYEMLVRTRVVAEGNAPVNKMNSKARRMVNAKAQCNAYFVMRISLPRTSLRCSEEAEMQIPIHTRKTWIFRITVMQQVLKLFSAIFICPDSRRE